jgi:hypothetical protein
MIFTEIRKWAKQQGFDVIKEKDDSINGASYYWASQTDTSISGVSLSVSKLARDIFNTMTDNKWKEHQENYKENKEYQKFNISDY